MLPSRPAALPHHAAGRQNTAQQRYQNNLGLIGLCLKRFSFPAEEKEDAQAAGRFGLWEAAQSFDPAKGFQFSSYAAVCIHHALLHHLRGWQRETRLPTVPLDAPRAGADGETSRLGDVLPDDPAFRPGAALVAEAGFEDLVAGLPARQQDVLRAIYGEGITATELARRQGVPLHQVQYLQKSALRALRRQRNVKQD